MTTFQVSRRKGLISVNEGRLPNFTIAWGMFGLRFFAYVAICPGLRWSRAWQRPQPDLAAILGLG